MVTVLIGAIIGSFSVAGGGYLLGATLWASIMAGAALGSLFMQNDLEMDSLSPTYSFQGVQNTKTQLLPIPILYGRCRVAGNIFYQAYLDSQKQTVQQFVGISEGPVYSITGILAGDIDPTILDGCSVSSYLNSTGVTDSRNPSGARPYPDDIAFIAMTLKAQEKLSGSPVITSIVEGRIVWTPSGPAYTRNPAWIIRDFLTNKRYGFGIPEALIDAPSFAASASYCDEVVAGGPRFTLDYVVDAQRSGIDHLQIMLSAFRGFIICRNKIQLKIDAPVSAYSAEVGPDEIIEGSFSWWQSADEDILNRVIVNWIDPDNAWENTCTVFEDGSDIEARGIIEKSFSLLPITRKEQAARMGAYLIDSAAGVKNFCAMSVGLNSSDIEAGDVIAVTNDLPGWNKKQFRVVKVADSSDDAINLTCSEYVAEIYNDRALDFPVHVDTNLPNLYECPNVVSLQATERVTISADGTILSDVDITWIDPPVLLRSVEVLLLEYNKSVYQSCGTVAPNTQNFVIRGLNSCQTIVIKVRATNSKGIRAIGATISLTLYGKATPPGVPTSFTAVGGFQTVQIGWVNPGDADLAYVEIKESVTSDILDAYTIGRISGTMFSRTNLATLRPYWYWIRSVDTTGNVSAWVGSKSATTTAIVMEDFAEGIIDQSAIVEEVLLNIDAEALLEGVDLGLLIEPYTEDLAQTILDAALQNDEDFVRQNDDLTVARDTLHTEITEGVSAEASKRVLLASQVDNNLSAIQNEAITRSQSDNALASTVDGLGVSVAGNLASINLEKTTRANQDTVLSQSIISLGATVNQNVSAIQNEQTVRSSADETLAQNISVLASSTGQNASAIQTESITRASADGTLASNISTLTSAVAGANAAISAELTTRANADIAISQNVTSQVSTLNTAIGQNTSAILNEAITRANADSATTQSITSQISTVNTAIGQNTASIQTNANTIASVDGNVKAQYTLQVQAIGAKKAVAGIGLLANGQTGTSEFTVLADKFFIYNPSDGAIKPVFQIVNNQAWLKGDLIADGTIQGAKINAGSQIQLGAGGQLLIDSTARIQLGSSIYMDKDRAMFSMGSFQMVDYIGGVATVPFEKRSDGKIYMKDVIADKAKISDATLTNAAIGSATITSAMIQDAAITNAKIADLTVGRIKMASGASAGLSWGNSVSASSGSGHGAGSGYFYPLGSTGLVVSSESRGRVLINAFIKLQHWHSGYTIYLTKNGSVISTLGSAEGGVDPYDTYFTFFVDNNPADGTANYNFLGYQSYGEATYVGSVGITALTIYR